jgi:hypothetical protein
VQPLQGAAHLLLPASTRLPCRLQALQAASLFPGLTFSPQALIPVELTVLNIKSLYHYGRICLQIIERFLTPPPSGKKCRSTIAPGYFETASMSLMVLSSSPQPSPLSYQGALASS